MSKKTEKHHGRSQDGPRLPKFKTDLPVADQRKKDKDKNSQGELDLDVGGIESRLPYGSEDIADK